MKFIEPYKGVGLMKPHQTGDASICAIKNDLYKIANFPAMERSRQSCRVPDIIMNPIADFSSLELVQFDGRARIKINGKGSGIYSKFKILHWLENGQGVKIWIWELFELFDGITEEAARVEYEEKKRTWREHGYFSLDQWKQEQESLKEKASLRKLIRAAQSSAIPRKNNFLPPIVDEYEAQLNDALWKHLTPMMPHTVAAKMAGNEGEAIRHFAHEVELPHDPIDQIDGIILRELNFAHLNKLPPPSDKQIVEALRAASFRSVNPEQVKKRRQKLGVSGLHQRGPKAKF